MLHSINNSQSGDLQSYYIPRSNEDDNLAIRKLMWVGKPLNPGFEGTCAAICFGIASGGILGGILTTSRIFTSANPVFDHILWLEMTLCCLMCIFVFGKLGVFFLTEAINTLRLNRVACGKSLIDTKQDIRWTNLKQTCLDQPRTDAAEIWEKIVIHLSVDTMTGKGHEFDNLIANYMEATEDVPALSREVEGKAKDELDADFSAAAQTTIKSLIAIIDAEQQELDLWKAEAEREKQEKQMALEESNRLVESQKQMILGQKVSFAREKMQKVLDQSD